MPMPMLKLKLRSLLMLLTMILLTACGGGGGGGNTLVESPNYAQLASTAALYSSVDLTNNTVKLNWKDTFPVGSTYAVQTIGAGAPATVSMQAARVQATH